MRIRKSALLFGAYDKTSTVLVVYRVRVVDARARLEILAPASWAYALQYPALAGQAYAFGYLDAGSLRVLRVILLSRQTAVKADLRPAAVVVIAV